MDTGPPGGDAGAPGSIVADGNFSAVKGYYAFDNRQSQSETSGVPAAAAVEPGEGLKNGASIRRRSRFKALPSDILPPGSI